MFCTNQLLECSIDNERKMWHSIIVLIELYTLKVFCGYLKVSNTLLYNFRRHNFSRYTHGNRYHTTVACTIHSCKDMSICFRMIHLFWCSVTGTDKTSFKAHSICYHLRTSGKHFTWYDKIMCEATYFLCIQYNISSKTYFVFQSR